MQSIYQLLVNTAMNYPNKIAAKFGQTEFSYHEILSRVDKVAAYLMANNFNNKVILLALPRNIDLLISIFSILKCNSTYIPVDLSYPIDRIKYVMENSNSSYVLTTSSSKAMFLDDSHVLCIEDMDMNDNWDSSVNINTDIYDEKLAYIIYTSGSTGKPKGVMVYEKALINFMEGMRSVINFDSEKSIICLTTVSFDIFFVESIMPLCIGMTVILANDHESTNSKMTANLIEKHQVDMIQMTPSRARLLMDVNPSVLQKVSELIIGGEEFPANLLADLQNNTNAGIYNVYGPTEATIWATIKKLNKSKAITIGQPLVNYEVYILDENYLCVPEGVSGELCIAGAGLAAGYMNNKELTDQKYVYVPHLAKKVYRTGDYAKILLGGDIKFIGRMDNQVKVRGYRIELQEIEEVAYESGLVNQAVVLVYSMNDVENLVLYYTTNKTLDQMDLKQFLNKKLPHYMVPSRYVELEAMPYTPNGKLDRKALAGSISMINESPKSDNLPMNGEEHSISDVIYKILEVITGSNHYTDHTLASEIDSINMIKVLVQIETYFNISIEDEMLDNNSFETIGDLIKYISNEVNGINNNEVKYIDVP